MIPQFKLKSEIILTLPVFRIPQRPVGVKFSVSKEDIACITLDIEADQVFCIYEDYLRLLSLDRLTTKYKELGNDGIDLLNYLYNQLKWEGLTTKEDIHRIIGTAGELGNWTTPSSRLPAMLAG